MPQNLGKEWETHFKKDWSETVEDSICYRLIDAQGGYFGVKNVSDFFCYKCPNLYMIDCKSKLGNTLNFNEISQYDKMLEYKGIKGIFVGVMVWFRDHDKCVWVPIETLEQIKLEGKKSFNIKMVDDYKCFIVPSKKLRTFIKCDYSKFIEYSLQAE